jgi:L-ascorbate metabolism protein UlaG (beta-lactamase superfamily)
VFPERAEHAAVGLDLALLPVGGWGPTLGPGHMDPEAAAHALTLLRPRAAVPVHWGSLRVPVAWRLRPDRYALPGQRFAQAAQRLAPEVRVHVLATSEGLTLAG